MKYDKLVNETIISLFVICLLLLTTVLAGVFLGPQLGAANFSDITGQPAEIRTAINWASDNGYMDGDGEMFYPNAPVTRIDYARAVVRLFGKQAAPLDRSITFPDIDCDSEEYLFANIAVQNCYIGPYPDGSFRPYEWHTTVSCVAGVVHGLGFNDGPESPVASIGGMWTDVPSYTGYSIAASTLSLKYESTRTSPTSAYPRGEMAYTLYKAKNHSSSYDTYLRRFTPAACQSPLVGAQRGKALTAAFSKVGWPYVYGGESDREGGYDCSGLVYYVYSTVFGKPMKRVADDQARDPRYPTVSMADLLPGDPIFFYSSTNSSYVGHAGIYVGDGKFIHSTSSRNAGVSVDFLTGSYATRFAGGKRIVDEAIPENYDTYILLSNPTDSRRDATLAYMLPDGSTVAESRSLDPYSRATVKVNDLLPDNEFSTMVEAASGGIVAERAMYFRYHNIYPGGHASAGSTALANHWYFAEGCTAYGFDTYILLQNPSHETAYVDVTFMLEGGGTISHELFIEGLSRYTILVDDLPGMEIAEFSTSIRSDRPIVAERSVYFDYNGITGGHNAFGITELATEWHLAEGCTAYGFDTYLLVANPNGTEVVAEVALLDDDGDTLSFPVTIPANARETIVMDNVSGWEQREFSISVFSDHPVAVERAMYFTYNGITGGHAANGVSKPGARWFLAEGYTGGTFDTFVLVSNPGDQDASVSVRFMRPGGGYIDRTYTVAGRSRRTITVDEVPGLEDAEVSTLVNSDHAVVVERSMYFNYNNKPGGSCATAVEETSGTWYFAEGYTGR